MTGEVDAAAAEATSMDPVRLQALIDDLDARYVRSGKLPHLQIMISRDERPLAFASRGQARADGTPLRDDALFRIASMTKPLTSVAFMMLVEEGRVALDDPVTDVLPEFAALRVGVGGETARPMRMIDLLRHTSGLTYGLQRRTAIDARYRDLGLDEFQQKRSGDEFIAALAVLPLEFQPGTAWNYSVATDVLGVVIERLTGQSLEAVIRARICGPLGMDDTWFVLPSDRTDRLTDAWRLAEEGGSTVADWGARSGWQRSGRLNSGGGGLVSSSADYHRFARMLLRGGELDGVRLLRPETVAAMRSNQLPGGGDLAALSTGMFSEADYAGTGFGLGFAVDGRSGIFYWGGVFSTFFFVDPGEAIIAILMTQFMPSSLHPIRAELRAAVDGAILNRRNRAINGTL